MRNADIDSFKGISMEEFLTNYANLDGFLTEEQILNLKFARATHQDLTELGIPYLKRVPQDIVTEEDILSGDVLIVNDFRSTDRRKRPAPYIRPELVKRMEEEKARNKCEYNNHDIANDFRKKELKW